MQALRANPADPLQHHFGASVRFVFSSACALICGLWAISHSHPLLFRRFPVGWSHGFSAAVCLFFFETNCRLKTCRRLF